MHSRTGDSVGSGSGGTTDEIPFPTALHRSGSPEATGMGAGGAVEKPRDGDWGADMGMGTGERGWGSRDGDGGAGMGMEERGWDSSPGSGEERMVPCECSVVIVCGNACLASRGKKK